MIKIMLHDFDVNVRNNRNTNLPDVDISKSNVECYCKSVKYAGSKGWNNA